MAKRYKEGNTYTTTDDLECTSSIEGNDGWLPSGTVLIFLRKEGTNLVFDNMSNEDTTQNETVTISDMFSDDIVSVT